MKDTANIDKNFRKETSEQLNRLYEKDVYNTKQILDLQATVNTLTRIVNHHEKAGAELELDIKEVRKFATNVKESSGEHIQALQEFGIIAMADLTNQRKRIKAMETRFAEQAAPAPNADGESDDWDDMEDRNHPLHDKHYQ